MNNDDILRMARERAHVQTACRQAIDDWSHEVSAELAKKILEALEAPQPAAQPLTKEAIRAAGGIVHGDGNIFFTSIEQLNGAHGIGKQS